MTSPSFLRLILILFAIGAAWGLSVPLAKIAVSTGHGPFGLIMWELIFATVALGVVTLARGNRFAISANRLVLFAVVGLTGTVLPGAFSYTAAAQLPAGVMAIVIALVPLCALPIAILLKLEVPNMKRFLGVLLGSLAVVLIVGPQDALPDPSKVGFVLIALIAPFFYAIETNYVSWKGTFGLDPVQTLLGSSFVALLFTIPPVWIGNEWINPLAPWGAPEWSLLGLSALHVSAYCAYIWLVGRAGSVFASQVAYLVTIFGVLWSIALLSEGYSAWIWASLVTLLIGVALVLPNPKLEELHQG